LLPLFALSFADAGYFSRRYFDSVPFLPRKLKPAIASATIITLLISSGTFALFAVKRWGRLAQVVADESPLPQSAQLSSAWYSQSGDLLGYRQEGWKITLTRWRVEKGLVPSSLALDLESLSISQALSSKKSPGNDLPTKNSPYLQSQLSAGLSKGSSNGPASRLPAAPLVAVSQDLIGIVWIWQGRLYWTVLSEHLATAKPSAVRYGLQGMLASASFKNGDAPFPAFDADSHQAERREKILQVTELTKQAQGSQRRVLSHNLPVEIGDPVGIEFVGATTLMLQDEATQRIWLYDLQSWTVSRSFRAPTPCAIDVRGSQSLVGCPSSGELFLLDISSQGDPISFRVPAQKNKLLGLTSLGLALDGAPIAATDQGTILLWPKTRATTQEPQELPSPGVSEAIASDGQSVLAGGGFRGIYQLRQGSAPKLIVKDVTGTTLIALKDAQNTAEGLETGNFTFGTREGLTVAHLRTNHIVNQWGYTIIASWVSAAALWLILIPLGSLWAEAVTFGKEVRLRREIEKTYERVPASSAGESQVPPVLPDPPEELIKACVSDQCVAFVGAGLGVQAGIPVWRAMIQSLLTEASRRQLIDPIQSSALQEALEEGQTNVVADELVDKLRGQETFLGEFLSRTYLRQDIRPTPVHSALRSLNLSAVLATSYDELVEATFSSIKMPVYTQQDADRLLEALTKKQFFLAKLYGSLKRPDSLLMARSQFEEAMARNPLFSRFMQTLFFSKTLFFVGAGFEGIESYLSGIKFVGSIEKRHFALVAADGAAWRAKADQLLRRFGIQVLAFSSASGYSDVEQFLGKLGSGVQSRLAEAPAKSGKRETARTLASRLQSVTLKNIGPFSELNLDLNAGWTILLGDNGVGKSTVLRAISVGLAGSEAADFAGRLIKSGQEAGSIILRTDGGKLYTTNITKGDRTIVQSETSRPLEAEGWLALGFPPLRSFTLAPVSDLPSKGLQRLTAEDLLPLIRGEVDPRPDKLKAWLVDLDYRDKTERVSNRTLLSYFRAGEIQTQFTSLLEQFFRVIRTLTPGLKLENVKIDPDKKEVRVNTGDGEVRIELVSQGMQSLLGWVGVLLQRLNDYYSAGLQETETQASGSSNSLLEQHALVLMDEIDAHMHPFWQKQIIPSLKELFPNMQFIATTHSPLIVSSLEKENVRIFDRDIESGEVAVTLPDIDFYGLRADQILTSRMFRLRTTRTKGMVEKMETYSKLLGARARAKEGGEPFLQEEEFEKLQAELQQRLKPGESVLYKEIEEAVQKTLRQMRSVQSLEGKMASSDFSPDEKLKIRFSLMRVLGEESDADKGEEKK
jgi:hypothetical protein